MLLKLKYLFILETFIDKGVKKLFKTQIMDSGGSAGYRHRRWASPTQAFTFSVYLMNK